MSHEKPPQMLRLPTSHAQVLHQPAANASQWQVGSRYLLLVLIWSSTPLAVVWSVRELHPVWALTCRFILAALLAYAICRVLGQRILLHRQAIHSYIAGSLSLIGAMLLTYLAAPHLASGLISLLYGFSPLIAGLMGFLFNRNQTVQVEQWVGMLIALLGLSFICVTGESRVIQPVGVVLILLAVACYVGSMFWVRQVQANLSPLVQTTGSLVVSALGMLLVIPFFWQEAPTRMPSMLTILAILYSVVVASIVAMLCYFDLVQRLSPSTVALTTILTPVLALFWGNMLNHEHIGSDMVLGVVVILLGLVLYFIRDWYQQYGLKARI